MSCPICGRGACARYMHSLEEQDRFEAALKFSNDVRAIMLGFESKDAEIAELRAKIVELEAERDGIDHD